MHLLHTFASVHTHTKEPQRHMHKCTCACSKTLHTYPTENAPLPSALSILSPLPCVPPRAGDLSVCECERETHEITTHLPRQLISPPALFLQTALLVSCMSFAAELSPLSLRWARLQQLQCPSCRVLQLRTSLLFMLYHHWNLWAARRKENVSSSTYCRLKIQFQVSSSKRSLCLLIGRRNHFSSSRVHDSMVQY